jgi:putative ABC transport system substrate-binding protein
MRTTGQQAAGLRRRAGADAARRSTRRRLLLALGAGAMFVSCVGAAQPAKPIARIGYLNASSIAFGKTRIDAFLSGMRELGRVEGGDFTIEYRHADGALERLPGLAAELVGLNVDVIVAAGLPAARAAKQATTTIPIVMTGGDPVRAGLVKSLARPGGNVTGLSDGTVNVSMKRLEMLKEISPKISRVAMLWNPANPTNLLQVKDTEEAARILKLAVQAVEVKSLDDFARSFTAIRKGGAGGLLVPGDPMFNAQTKQITDFAAKNRLPAIFISSLAPKNGGLMSYGTNFEDLSRRLATFVDKVLKGVKPADIPVEEPTRLELIINLKTAKMLGIRIPNSILVRADRVIE